MQYGRRVSSRPGTAWAWGATWGGGGGRAGALTDSRPLAHRKARAGRGPRARSARAGAATQRGRAPTGDARGRFLVLAPGEATRADFSQGKGAPKGKRRAQSRARSDLRGTADAQRAKAYFERIEGGPLPMFKVRVKTSNLLKDFLIQGVLPLDGSESDTPCSAGPDQV